MFRTGERNGLIRASIHSLHRHRPSDGELGERRTDPANGAPAPPQQPDQEILSHLMRSIPGVDFTDPEVQAALRGIELEQKDDSHDKKSKDERDDKETK